MAVRIGHLSTFYHTSILLMAGGALDGPLGGVSWRLFGTGPEIVGAFERSEIDLAYIGVPPAVIGIERGVRIKCIAGGHVEGTMVCGLPELRGYPEVAGMGEILSQLRGLRVGVPGAGSIHDVILQDSLRRHALKDDVTVVNYRWADEITEAVARRHVAAAFGTPSLGVAVRRYAGGKILFPPFMIWPSNPSYGIFSSEAFLRSERGSVETFLRHHEDATTFLRTDMAGAARVIADFVGIVDREFVFDVLGLSPKYCAQVTEGYVRATLDFVRALRQMGYTRRLVSREEIFDTSIIEGIHPPGDHYESAAHPEGE